MAAVAWLALLALVALDSANGNNGGQNLQFRTIVHKGDRTFTELLGINNAGVVAGFFGAGDRDTPSKGFIASPPYQQDNFEDRNFPGSKQTEVTCINNNGLIVGTFADKNNNNFGFFRDPTSGTYTKVDSPEETHRDERSITQLLGVNDLNQAVGFFVDDNRKSRGFLFDINSGQFSPIRIDGARSVTPSGINNVGQGSQVRSGLICGFFTTHDGVVKAFLLRVSQPQEAAFVFTFPGAVATFFLGINNNGVVVGGFEDQNGKLHGLIFDSVSGNAVQVDAPGGEGSTTLTGINDNGQIVGFFFVFEDEDDHKKWEDDSNRWNEEANKWGKEKKEKKRFISFIASPISATATSSGFFTTSTSSGFFPTTTGTGMTTSTGVSTTGTTGPSSPPASGGIPQNEDQQLSTTKQAATTGSPSVSQGTVIVPATFAAVAGLVIGYVMRI